MTNFIDNQTNSEVECAALGENPQICSVCGGPLCEHGLCAKSIPECLECQGKCPDCGADLCLHGHCQNYCDLAGDGPCPECWERMCLEKEAAMEAAWQRNVMGPMLGFREDAE